MACKNSQILTKVKSIFLQKGQISRDNSLFLAINSQVWLRIVQHWPASCSPNIVSTQLMATTTVLRGLTALFCRLIAALRLWSANWTKLRRRFREKRPHGARFSANWKTWSLRMSLKRGKLPTSRTSSGKNYKMSNKTVVMGLFCIPGNTKMSLTIHSF